jgi:hypothetical protein
MQIIFFDLFPFSYSKINQVNFGLYSSHPASHLLKSKLLNVTLITRDYPHTYFNLSG